MTTPSVKTFKRGGSRFYRHPADGDSVPGVTSIIGTLDKPAITGWVSKVTAERAVDRLGDWIHMALSGDPEGAKRWIKGARYEGTAAKIGDAVHELVERRALGETVRWHPDFDGHMRGWDAFVEAYNPEVVLVEATAWSKRHRYAGTLDLACWIGPEDGRELAIIDVKTGAGVYPEVALQLAAYAHAEVTVDGETGEERPMPAFDGAAVLHLRPDSWQLVPVDISDRVFDAFLSVRQAWEWKHEGERNVIGKPLSRAEWGDD